MRVKIVKWLDESQQDMQQEFSHYFRELLDTSGIVHAILHDKHIKRNTIN
jgi:hypothetical protein